MPFKNKDEKSAYHKLWYGKNKSREVQRVKNTRLKKRETIDTLKIKCSHCEENDKVCLDFHHIDGKHEGISRLIQNNAPLEKILFETNRCIVLCKNCHAKIHRDNIGKKLI